jgi:hypothetical protein
VTRKKRQKPEKKVGFKLADVEPFLKEFSPSAKQGLERCSWCGAKLK